jgi:DNA polymerase-1
MPKLPPKNGVKIDRINTLLIDGNALYKRGYTGSHNAYNKKGKHVGGIYQFITVLRMLLSRDVFHNVYVFWDGRFSGKLRWEIYKDYKVSRGKDYVNGTEPQDPYEKLQQFRVKQYLYHLSIRQIEDAIVEADDYIAYYCKHKEPNEDITICTSDRDIVQLISDTTKIWLCDLKEYVVLGNYSLYFKHHHENVALIKTIAGDNSDDIKGVKGVKEPTLLKHFPFLAERKSDLLEVLSRSE